MHQTFTYSNDATLYYRYNPQSDVLALRLQPDFKAAQEEPLPDQPGVSLSRDPEGGAILGLRIGGVQQLLLQSLIRQVMDQAAPALGLAPAAPVAPQVVAAAAPVPVPAAPEPQPLELAASMPDAPLPDDADDDDFLVSGVSRGRNRRRRRRGSGGMDQSEGAPRVETSAPRRDLAPAEPLAIVPRASAPEPRDAYAVPVPSPVAFGESPQADIADAWSEPAISELDDSDATAEPDGRPRRPRRRRRRSSGAVTEGTMPSAAEDDAPWADERPSVDAAQGTDETPDAISMPEAPRPVVAPVTQSTAPDGADVTPPAFAGLGLHPLIGKAIRDLGFTMPTPIQQAAIPLALEGHDLIGLAQTGTGKTLAFVGPSVSRMLASPRGDHRPRMLILTPTRELAVQVALEAERLAAHTDLRVATVYGGVNMGDQTDALRRGVDLVVATPGRILDHLRRRNANLGAVEILVLDEADRMLDMGFLPDVRDIIRQMPAQRQTMLFTATFPAEIESLSLEFQKQPQTVEIARRKPPESIEQRLYPVGKHLKAPLMVHLLESDPTMDRVLIFTERKVDADVLARKLRTDGISVALMHGDRTQKERERALDDLKERKVRVLVATNVAARGLDIEEISHVVNYDIPQSVDEYVHRIGRTARAEMLGKAYSLVTMSDEVMVSRIEAALSIRIPRVQAPGFDYDVTPPSWAKPSADDVLAWLNKDTSVSDRLRSLSRRRR